MSVQQSVLAAVHIGALQRLNENGMWVSPLPILLCTVTVGTAKGHGIRALDRLLELDVLRAQWGHILEADGRRRTPTITTV